MDNRIIYGHFVERDNCRWFWNRCGGGFYCKNLDNQNIALEYAYQTKNYFMISDCLFDIIISLDTRFFLVPRYAKEVLVLDFENMQIFQRELPEVLQTDAELFLDAFQTEEDIVLISQCYQGFLHINKKSLKVRVNKAWYKAYHDLHKECLKENCFIFRTVLKGDDENIYLPFYNSCHILKYNICSMNYAIFDTEKISKELEIYEDDSIKLLIINRMDILKVNCFSEMFFVLFYEFVKENHVIKAINYRKDIYLFTNDNIYIVNREKDKIELVEWFAQIKVLYQNRIYMKGGDRLQDTLYVFQNDDTLIISFELSESKYIIKICHDEVTIENEKIEYSNCCKECEALLYSNYLRDIVDIRKNKDVGALIYQTLKGDD